MPRSKKVSSAHLSARHYSPGHRATKAKIFLAISDTLTELKNQAASVDGDSALLNTQDQDYAPAPSPSKNPEYEERVERSSRVWSEKEGQTKVAYSEFMKPLGQCIKCKAPDAPFRCFSCNLLQICWSCLEVQHSHHPPHTVDRWNGKIYVSVEVYTVLSRRCSCSEPFDIKEVILVDDSGDEFNASVEVCSCNDLRVTLIQHGFWPLQADPGSANRAMAVCMKVLPQLIAISKNCAASLSGACSALASFRSPLWGPSGTNLYRRLNTFGSMTAFRRLLGSIQWEGKTTCPACFTSEHEDTLQTPLIVQLDGCFGMRHRASAGRAPSPIPDPEGYFIEIDASDEPDVSPDSCPNWKAGVRGHELTTAKDKSKLDVFGLFASSCRHGSVLTLSDMTTRGESLKYAVASVNYAIARNPRTRIVVSYDIACKLQAAFRDMDINLVVPALHAYGHSWKCQMSYGVRFQSGVGLTDGEGCERLWSYFRRFSAQTKEMTHINRRRFLDRLAADINFDVVSNITSSLQKRIKHLQKTKTRLESELADFAFNNQLPATLAAFEVFVESWTPEFRAEVMARTHRRSGNNRDSTISNLAALTAEREYLVRHCASERGQKMAKRLALATKTIETKRRNLVQNFNSGQPAASKSLLRLEDFSDFSAPGFRDAHLSNLETDMSTRMVAFRLYNLLLRTREEQGIIQCEVRRTTRFFLRSVEQARDYMISSGQWQCCPVQQTRLNGLIHLLQQHITAFPSEKVIAQGLDDLLKPPESASTLSPGEEPSDSETLNESDSDVDFAE